MISAARITKSAIGILLISSLITARWGSSMLVGLTGLSKLCTRKNTTTPTPRIPARTHHNEPAWRPVHAASPCNSHSERSPWSVSDAIEERRLGCTGSPALPTQRGTLVAVSPAEALEMPPPSKSLSDPAPAKSSSSVSNNDFSSRGTLLLGKASPPMASPLLLLQAESRSRGPS